MILQFKNKDVKVPDDAEFISLWSGLVFKRIRGGPELRCWNPVQSRWVQTEITMRDLPWLDSVDLLANKMLENPNKS